eukprot:9024600-Pyramimonas_sp.AAC.1
MVEGETNCPLRTQSRRLCAGRHTRLHFMSASQYCAWPPAERAAHTMGGRVDTCKGWDGSGD